MTVRAPSLPAASLVSALAPDQHKSGRQRLAGSGSRGTGKTRSMLRLPSTTIFVTQPSLSSMPGRIHRNELFSRISRRTRDPIDVRGHANDVRPASAASEIITQDRLGQESKVSSGLIIHATVEISQITWTRDRGRRVPDALFVVIHDLAKQYSPASTPFQPLFHFGHRRSQVFRNVLVGICTKARRIEKHAEREDPVPG